MIRILLVLSIAIWGVGAARATEKITLDMSPNDAAATLTGLNSLNGYLKVVHNAAGAEESVSIPYSLGDVRIALARDIRAMLDLVRDYQTAAKAMKPEEAAHAADAKQPLDILVFQVGDLNLTANPIAPGTLALLAPVCPSCIGK